jgi:hypothetical protein
VYKNAPIFEDEFLFPKELKNCLKIKDKNLEWFLVDWNNNGLYDEFGIDYLGLQSKLDEKPLLTILKERNYIKVDTQNYVIANISNYRNARKAATDKEVDLTSMTKFVPIELTNKESLIPEFKTDFTIIYFWATWSRSSKEVLLFLDYNKLKEASIDFIPIAYNCSNVERFIKENNLHFPPFECLAQGVEAYHLRSATEQFIFDQKGNLLNSDEINLEDYFKN